MMRPTRPTALALQLGLLAAAAACQMSWGGAETEGEPTEAPEEATPVVVVAVERGSIAAGLSVSSTIEAERHVTVHAESTGQVLALDVEEGEPVQEGALLARIQYDAQSSLLERATTSLDKAESDYARIKALHDRGAASREELDNAQLAVQNARLERRDRRRDVSNTRVVAPFSGTLTERLVSAGAFVTSGQALFSITDFSTLVARIYVPEKELDRLRIGQAAEVVGRAARGRRGSGTVARIAPIVDAATGTVKVTIALPADQAGPEGFLPGMYAEVTLTTERRDGVTLVPKPALVREDDQVHVFVVEGDRARRRVLQLGLADEERVEVRSGVEAEERIVVAGQAGLRDGALVRLVDTSGRAEDDAPAEGTSGPSLAAATEQRSGGS